MTPTPLTIVKGKTFQHVVRWEEPPIVYKAITDISKAAPCRVTAPTHGVLDGWRVAIAGLEEGPVELNGSVPPKDKDLRPIRRIDANVVEFNEVSSALLDAYVSGGFLLYYTPVDMTGFTARMQIKDKVGGTQLLLLTTENGRLAIDNTAKTILITIAEDDAIVTWKKGVYDLEAISAGGVVYLVAQGPVVVDPEVTTYPD